MQLQNKWKLVAVKYLNTANMPQMLYLLTH